MNFQTPSLRACSSFNMVPHFSVVFLLSFFAGIQCRSIVSSNLNEATSNHSKNLTSFRDDNNDEIRRFFTAQGIPLDKILAELNSKNNEVKDYEEKTAQWLRLLRQMLQSLSSGKNLTKSRLIDMRFNDVEEVPRVMIAADKKKVPFAGYNWLDDLFEFLDEQEIDGQSSEENRSHVKSRYENSSNFVSLKTSEATKKDADRASRKEFQELDKMLVDVQHQIERVRKNFQQFCSKHHSIFPTEWPLQIDGDGSSNEILPNNQ
ncbi:uncharacterized protein [Venturia canescens]|uniref:uncharacterized protein n=1 Tax=Venturia canescens TaxID=32260 RepID=UPI001C9C9B17|nr:uncharacterized protein LOC122418219 [Venturia canescens]